MELNLPKSHEKMKNEKDEEGKYYKCDLTISIIKSKDKEFLLVLGPEGRDGRGEYWREEIRSGEKKIDHLNSLNHEWSY
jgi:hypothetical protein